MAVIAASAALFAVFAVAAARLELAFAADVLAVGAVLCGLTAFLSAAISTIRRAGDIPPGANSP